MDSSGMITSTFENALEVLSQRCDHPLYVADRVFRHSPVSVTVVCRRSLRIPAGSPSVRGIQESAPSTRPVIPSHVLVPLDGSPLADEALTNALTIFDCRITVLNVVTPLDNAMSEGGVLEPGEQRRTAARERADRLIGRAEHRAAADGRTIETAVETGDPAETILEYIEDHDIDHVVMGGHGGERGELARRLLGTVATTVVGEAPVTVTVVR